MAKRLLAAQVSILKHCTGAIKKELARGRKCATAKHFLSRAEENLLNACQELGEWEACYKEDTAG